MVHLPLLLPVLVGYLSTLSKATSDSTQCTPPEKNTTYPDKCHITKVFNYLSTGNDTAFFAQVAPDVQWTLMGTHPLAGQYRNRTVFITDSLERLDNTLDPAFPTNLTLTHVVGGGDEEWSVQELHGLGVCKNGLLYDNRFAWISRWDLDWKIVEMRAYLDSFLVNKAITENESGQSNYTMQRTALVPGPMGLGCKATCPFFQEQGRKLRLRRSYPGNILWHC